MGRGTSKASGTKADAYFKTDWEEGTGPGSASFKDGLATGKRWMERGYSWNELVDAVQSEYFLNDDETSVLNDKLKMFAIQHGNYPELHADWLEDFRKRKIKVIGRRTKVEIELGKMR